MNLAPHTQALMLAVFYGEASDAERNEWELLITANPALLQECERLKATITIINDAEKSDDEEDIFFAAQWEELRKVMKPDDTAPVMIVLPQIEKVESARKAKSARLVTVATQRWYWAAATILVAVGLSFSVYRWQMNELKSSSVQNTVQESDATPRTKNTEQSEGASLSGKADAAPSRENQKNEIGNISTVGRRSEPQEKGTRQLAQPQEQKPSAAPLVAPQNRTSSDQSMPSDDAKENVAKDKESSRLEDKKESTPIPERKKNDEAQAEESLKLQNKQSVEAEAVAPKLSAPKRVVPQGFDGASRFQSAPALATPQNAPSALPTNAKPASIQSSAKRKLFSTNATIRLDSAQKRDSSTMKR
jgi:hypothetical protein